MRVTKYVTSEHFDSDRSKASATIYDLSVRRSERLCQSRVSELEYENALLTDVLAEMRKEVARLRNLLASL